MFAINCMALTSEIMSLSFYFYFVSPPGKPMAHHLRRCQGFVVAYYDFTLGRLGYGVPSTFAQLGLWP